MKTVSIQDIAEIRLGYPFREMVKDDPEGTTLVIQVKNVDEVQGIAWDKLAHTNLTGRRTPDWLESGDILFAARGHRNFAVCLGEVKSNTVCSPRFFQIHLKKGESKIKPEYLAWFINQRPAQAYFAKLSEGSRVHSINKSILGNLLITIPTLEKQNHIIELHKRVKQEHILLQKKMNNSRAMMSAIAQELITESKAKEGKV